jgi:hypothetical protein
MEPSSIEVDTSDIDGDLGDPRGVRRCTPARAKDLEGLKVGDDLDVTYTHAVVVDLVPPATE